jgi:hypothetical protein
MGLSVDGYRWVLVIMVCLMVIFVNGDSMMMCFIGIYDDYSRILMVI